MTPPLRIAIVAPPWYAIPPSAYGGIEAMVHDLTQSLTSLGHEVLLVAAGEYDFPVHQFAATFPYVRSEWLSNDIVGLAHALEARSRVHAFQPDVVHDHTAFGALLSAMDFYNRPTVVTVHGTTDEDQGRILQGAADLARTHGRTLHLVAISHAQRHSAPDLPWIATVHNGLDVAQFPFNADPDTYVAFLGRLSPVKGAHLAIDIARAAGRTIMLAGRIHGDDEQRYFDQEIAPRLGPDALWLGEADFHAKTTLLAAASAFVFPLQWDEPFGLVVAESLACGTPVLAMPRGALPEIVTDSVTGFLRSDPDDLIDLLAARADQELDRPTCREHVARNFDIRTMGEGYLAAYLAAIHTDRGRPAREVITLPAGSPTRRR